MLAPQCNFFVAFDNEPYISLKMIHSDVELLKRALGIDIHWEIGEVTENSSENVNIRDSIKIIDNVESLNTKRSNKSRQHTDAVKRIENQKKF
jgi:hypothetical protein